MAPELGSKPHHSNLWVRVTPVDHQPGNRVIPTLVTAISYRVLGMVTSFVTITGGKEGGVISP